MRSNSWANEYRHCKTIFALGSSAELLPMFGVDATLTSGDADRGVLTDTNGFHDAVAHFIAAVGMHRHRLARDRPAAI